MREVMLILHFTGLTMGLGTSFAHGFLSIATSKMSRDEAVRFQMHAMVLSRMGHIGLGLLILSGFYLITPYWAILPTTPLLILKLVLVVVLTVLIALIGILTRKARTANADQELKKMESLVR
ncbi:hypothetical protein [Dyadobacter sp. CY312]|uniref:hypothetical protein n=1 Tax=Dyadobacter sp. CY312 TaxID=2907303 RepID=UPI001F3C4138|nr:hypothetical protein [Dyadobacter sp. CY312]MCE7038843.1 hypothetical protein [Dyadobacter sp. CY312]